MTESQALAINASAKAALYAADQVGGPYVYGATAEPCTPGMRRQQMKQYGEYADKITRYCPVLSGRQATCEGCSYEGRIAHDCAQLTRFAAKAAGLKLPSGATSQWQDGDWAASGLIADLPCDYVCMVYRKNDGRMVHTGVYMADGTVVEARGHADGVVRGEVADYPWTHWAILRGMAVPPGAGLLQAKPVLRKGAFGEDVRRLQEALIASGYSCGDKGADGVFGAATRTAVMALQQDGAIDVDGIVGEMTWALLDKLSTGARYTVTIEGVTEAVAQKLVREYGGRMDPVMGGGMANG